MPENTPAAASALLPVEEARRCTCVGGTPTGLCCYPVGTCPREQEDEQRPVVGFLRLAGWSDEKIAEVVEAHKRGEVYTATVTIGGDRG